MWELGRELSAMGLDLGRYTSALAEHFLARFPSTSDWKSEETRAQLISTFAIGETTFLRHPEHFQTLRRLFPILAEQRRGAPLSMWSAGCASGEEAYSLAATALAFGHSSARVLAWDLNADAIERARLGEYRPWSLRGVEAHDATGWLLPHPCGVRVADHVSRLVSFAVGNLHTDAYPTDLDVVFCRNVLLYFRPEAAAAVIRRIALSLRPGGALFLGLYDPRPPADCGLTLEVHDGVHVYRRTLDGLARDRKSLLPRAPLPRPLTEPAAHVPLSLEGIRTLVNQRRSERALTTLAELRHGSPLDPSLHVLTALAAEDAGDVKLMLEAARRACFLVPDAAAPNYFLSVAFVRNGELKRAGVHRRIAAQALRGELENNKIVGYGEGLTVGQLRRLIGAIAR
jgi:chemotaxis methyl-accepting protein methylase